MKSFRVVFVVVLLLVGAHAHAGYVYTYQGSHFTSVTGSAPQVDTNDSLSGFVEFATAPAPGETGKTDWIAYSLTDGARTLSSANGDHQFFLDDFFDFDAALHIVAWKFSIVPDSEDDNGNIIITSSTFFDASRLDGSSIQLATTQTAGVWTAATGVPEPATLALLSLGLAGLGLSRRRKLI